LISRRGITYSGLAALAVIWLAGAVSAADFYPSTTDDLQDVVNAANANADLENTIHLAAGTYDATYQVHVTKTLTIVGAGAGSTTIVPTANTPQPHDDPSGWFLIDSAITFKLMDVAVDGSNYTIHRAIRTHARTLVEGCVFRYIGRYEPPGPSGFYYGLAISLIDNNLTVNDCSFSDIGRVQVHVFGPDSTCSLVTGNTFVGKGTGDWLDYAVEVGGGAFCEVTHNEISNCGSSTTAWGSSGLLASTYYGAGTVLRADYNLFMSNEMAIAVGYPPDTTVASAHYNNFVGNGWAIGNWSSNAVPAENNWWGATDGPGGDGPGSGDPIWSDTGAGAITYTPWLVAPVNQFGMPVDLNGTYLGPSCGTNPGAARAATVLGANRVDELSVDQGVLEGTHTPFSDYLKPPKDLVVNMQGRSYTFDLDLHDPSLWYTPVTLADNEYFAVGLGTGSPAPGAQVAWVMAYKGPSPEGFRIELQTTTVTGPRYYAPTDETKFHIEVMVSSNNLSMSAVVTPLNGAGAGVQHTIGPLALTYPGVDDVSNVWFFAGFTTFATKSKAKATVTELATDAAPNAMYLFADDPYVKTAEPVEYRLGMANVPYYLAGFQAFLANPSGGVQGALTSRFYSSSPFPLNLLPLGLQADGGIDFTAPHGNDGLLLDATLAHFVFGTPAAEGVAGLQIMADSGASLYIPTRFSAFDGSEVFEVRYDSNTVVVDSTPPALTLMTADQAHGSVLNGVKLAVQGAYTITIDARDTGPSTNGSGLADRPLISIDFPSGTDVVNAPMYSGADNVFVYEGSIAAEHGCGTASISITVADDAGNTATATGTLSLETATITVNLSLNGVSTSPKRDIDFVIGTGTGVNPPITVTKYVSFTSGAATVVLNALDSPSITCGAAYTEISAKDPLHTLRTKTAIAFTGDQGTATIALCGGDANDDNLIDILDFGIFAWKFGQNVGMDTPPGVYPHPDFNATGVVDTGDYTYIQTQFLTIGHAAPGQYGPQGLPRDKVTVQEMLNAGVKVAREYDLNRDGWITFQEIAQWLADPPGGSVTQRN
jgi:hypothetical protein